MKYANRRKRKLSENQLESGHAEECLQRYAETAEAEAAEAAEEVVKIQRAQGGCLGTKSRRKT